MKSAIYSLPDVTRIQVCSYLRAVDMANSILTNKVLFSKELIKKSISVQYDEFYSLQISSVANMDSSLENLFITEVKLVISLLATPQPASGRGYWISTTWLSNARKYYDALVLPDLDKKVPKGKKSKLIKIRQRRGSDCLPPWPNINIEITCEHGNLAIGKLPRGKRRIMDKNAWTTLRRFYSQGKQFKSTSEECPICIACDIDVKAAELKRLDEEKRSRQEVVQGILYPLTTRKTGVPSSYVYTKDQLEAISVVSSRPPQPLRPGLYHLVPKSWLRLWRQYIKDATISTLPMLDCTRLLCRAHGLLVIPPHVEDYLYHGRKGLLNGLSEYGGEIYEILSVEEWDSLRGIIGDISSDFNVRFTCDVDNHIEWSLDLCRQCSPFDYGDINVKARFRGLVVR